MGGKTIWAAGHRQKSARVGCSWEFDAFHCNFPFLRSAHEPHTRFELLLVLGLRRLQFTHLDLDPRELHIKFQADPTTGSCCGVSSRPDKNPLFSQHSLPHASYSQSPAPSSIQHSWTAVGAPNSKKISVCCCFTPLRGERIGLLTRIQYDGKGNKNTRSLEPLLMPL